MDELTKALAKAIEDQMKHGKTTLIEAMINRNSASLSAAMR